MDSKSIETLQQKREEANRLVQEISKSVDAAEKKLQDANLLLAAVQKSNAKSTSTNSIIDKTLSDSEQVLAEVKELRSNLRIHLNHANTFYEKTFLPLQLKIQDPQTGLSTMLSHSRMSQKSILEIENKVKLLFAKINQGVKAHQSVINNLGKVEKSINSIFKEVNRKSDLSKAAYLTISNHSKIISNKKVEIEKILALANTESNDISQFHRISHKNNDEIIAFKDQSNKLLTEIQTVYEAAFDTYRGGEFNKRKVEIKEELRRWEKYIQLSTFVLIVFIVGLFILQLCLNKWTLDNLNLNFYLRFFLASPIVYYIYFCNSQYSSNKRLYDKYTFKSTMAFSITGHLESLTKNDYFNKDEKHLWETLKFALMAYEKIYTEPYQDDELRLKIKLHSIELDIEKHILTTLRKVGVLDDKSPS